MLNLYQQKPYFRKGTLFEKKSSLILLALTHNIVLSRRETPLHLNVEYISFCIHIIQNKLYYVKCFV